MNTALELKEQFDNPVDLSLDEATYLAQHFGGRVSVTRRAAEPLFRVNPEQYVGVVTLPSGRALRFLPKVPAANLLAMLAIAYELPELHAEAASLGTFEEVLELFVSHFSGMVAERIDVGLYRTYEAKEERLRVLRGRLDLEKQVRQFTLDHEVHCRFSELTWDVPENQIVRHVIHLLSRWGFSRGLQRRLRELDVTMSEITDRSFAPDDVDGFQYNRLNEDYREIHKFCRFFLESSSLSEEKGPFQFRSFLLDMDHLFEKFVTAVLEQRQPPKYHVLPQQPGALDVAHQIGIKPDILVNKAGLAVSTADCKYIRQIKGEVKNENVFQVLSYCVAHNVKRGMLLYPKYVTPFDDSFAIKHLGITIRQLTIDLDVPFAGLSAECDRFADLFWAVQSG